VVAAEANVGGQGVDCAAAWDGASDAGDVGVGACGQGNGRRGGAVAEATGKGEGGLTDSSILGLTPSHQLTA
jgi:hypothetical protein